MATIEAMALAIHKNELAGLKLEGISSVSVLTELLELQHFVHGEEGDESISVYYRLAEVQAALGQHEEAVVILQSLLDKQRKRVGERHIEIAKLLRLLAVSFDKLDRTTEGSAARRDAYDIVAELLGKPEVVRVLSSIVADESRGTAGGAATPEAWEGAAVPKAVSKAQQAIPRRGDIWWVEFPQYPNDPHQPRPALVVSVDHRNERADKVQVVPLSSNNNGHRMNYSIPKAGTGLQYDSCAKCGDITAVAKVMLRGPAAIGHVSKEIVDGIVELAQQALFA
jgi:mRNA-degrading endonuclease toxin of MazEF toxin-antitoxin module